MKVHALTEHKSFRPAVGVALSVVCGLALWTLPIGERYDQASYDYLFRFGSRTFTNKVVLVLMDNEAYAALHQSRGPEGWDRALHAELLDKLAADGCPLVALDVFFRRSRDPETDKQLAEAVKRCRCAVLAASQTSTTHPGLVTAHPTLPLEFLLSAANTNWGVAWLDPDFDLIVRRHWPFPSPGSYPSLAWTAAVVSRARLDDTPQERWLRYYGHGSELSLSYHLALSKPTNYFRDKIVFVGNKPTTSLLTEEPDKFRTPYARWSGEASPGVELLATEFLNLMNGDWLRRPAWPVELVAFTLTGVCFGGGLCRLRRLPACVVACGAAFVLMIGAVLLSYFTNYWVPWLVVVGGQLPCALAWAVVPARPQAQVRPLPEQTTALFIPAQALPDAPEYDLVEPPLGEGGAGKVWLARNSIGQWQALKALYLAKFGNNPILYEAEFKGLQKYKPISEKHPGLLRIDLVSKKRKEGYFYYVMELGDSQTEGWERNPATYKPKDLESVRKLAEGGRLPGTECLRIGTILADALEFLHQQGLTHRDIKPSNIIFVNGRPKLADVGLVTDIRPPAEITTYAGSTGYMPPHPQPPGTAQADIYALGMVLFVISTGCNPDLFPKLSMTLMEGAGHPDFLRLNAIILKACQPDCAQRYQTTSEMLQALREAQQAVK